MKAPVVLKLSGKVSDTPKSLTHLAREVRLALDAGESVIVIHGGGKQLDQLCADLGVQPSVVAGRRVTDEKTISLAKMAFGAVNADITAALVAQGVPAVGFAAFGGKSLMLERRKPSEVKVGDKAQHVDWGFVGDVSSANADLLKHLVNGGYVPVISSLGIDREGTILNINADTVAVAVAAAIGARRLVMAGDTDGVFQKYGDPSSHLKRLGVKQAREMLASGDATGGMLPKLSAVTSWIESGATEHREVHVVSGFIEGAIRAAVEAGAHTGTVIAAT